MSQPSLFWYTDDMEKTRKFGSITSSQNPDEIATRVKGIILAFSSVIIFGAAQFFHITLSANDIVSLASELGSVAGAVMTLYGAGLWILAKIFKKPLPDINSSSTV